MPNSIKGLFVVVLFAGLMGFGWWKYDDFLSQGSEAPEGTQILNQLEANGVPDFEFTTMGGEKLSLYEYNGKSLVIVNFWASWCEPCIAEFPSLLKLIDHFKGKIILIAISADYNKEELDNFLKVFKATTSPYLKVMWDQERKLAKKFGTFVLPESYIVGRDGKLLRKVSGVDDWYNPNAIEYFGELIKQNGLSD